MVETPVLVERRVVIFIEVLCEAGPQTAKGLTLLVSHPEIRKRRSRCAPDDCPRLVVLEMHYEMERGTAHEVLMLPMTCHVLMKFGLLDDLYTILLLSCYNSCSRRVSAPIST